MKVASQNTMQNIEYSIIIPLYNKERQIAQTLDSVLAQSVTDFEVVVVDDGSKDKSAEIVKGFTDARIRYIKKENGGVSSARNRGIQEAEGEWLVFLDADDEMLPDALFTFEEMHKSFPTARLLVGGFLKLYKGKERKRKETDDSFHLTRFPYFRHWLNQFYPRPGAIAVHHNLVKQYGGFDERMSFFEDYDFGLRMMWGEKVAYTGCPVNVYKVDDEGLSHSHHSEKKEMAYYIPEMKTEGLFHRALIYENLEYTLNWWVDEPAVLAYYQRIGRLYFSTIYRILHWVRQKMVTHHWI